MQTATSNGIAIAYQDHGEGYPVVFIHGALMDHKAWRPQIQAFAADYRLIIPDLRGHGASDYPSVPMSIAQFADDIAGLLDALAIEQALVCGHSLGGMVAQELALRHAERVTALVLADTSYSTSSNPLEAFGTWLAWWTFKLTPIARMAAWSASAQGKHTPEVRDYIERMMNAYVDHRNTYLAIWRATLDFDSRDRLHMIDALTLVLVGSRNRQTHAQGRAIHQRIRGSFFGMVPNAGHMLNWDNPAFFNRTLLDFFAGALALNR